MFNAQRLTNVHFLFSLLFCFFKCGGVVIEVYFIHYELNPYSKVPN